MSLRSSVRSAGRLNALALLSLLAIACGPEPEPIGPDAGGSDGGFVDDDGGEPGDGGEETFDTLLDEQLVGPAGATLHDDERQVTVVFPEGALSEPTTVRLFARDLVTRSSSDPWVVPTRRFVLEPEALPLQEDVRVSLQAPAEVVPYRATPRDLGLYRREGDNWVVLELDAPQGSLRSFPSTLSVSGRTQRLGEIAARLHPPYDRPPVLDQIGFFEAVSTPQGPVSVVQPWSVQTIWGQGFGWDDSRVEVTVGGVRAQTSGVANAQLEFRVEAEPLTRTDLPVVVRVDGAASNTLSLRVAGVQSGQSEITSVSPANAAPRGTWVMLGGTFYGTSQTMKVTVAGTALKPQRDGSGMLWVLLPEAAPLGATTLVVEDGIGGAPSAPVPYVVTPSDSPALRPGLESGGLWLPRVALVEPAPERQPTVSVVLDVEPLSPHVAQTSKLSTRWISKAADTGWVEYVASPSSPAPCVGMPAGRCLLTVPNAALQGLDAGDTVSVQVRMQSLEHPAYGSVAQFVERQSAPLVLPIRGRNVLGAYATTEVGCSHSAYPPDMCQGRVLSVDDLYCFTAPTRCCDGVCADVQRVSAPGLWSGEIDFAAGASTNGVLGRCVMLTTPGTYRLTNHTIGTSCDVQVVTTGGQFSAGEVSGVDPSSDLELAIGGGRVSIPAGALPPLPAGGRYTVTARAPFPGDSDNPPLQSADPQQSTALGTYRLQVSPEPAKLLAPIGLSVPVDPAGQSPALGLIDRATGFVHEVTAQLDAVRNRLEWSLPAGRYEAPAAQPSPDPTPVALAAGFNTAFANIGVLYKRNAPGELEDPEGRVRVLFVVDPASDDHATEAYAARTLDAAIAAWTKLADEHGWRAPPLPLRLFVRRNVAWNSSTAKGATTPGFLGQVQMTVKNDLADAELAYVVAHEMGHVFQRQYTVNVTLSWLDEAAAEWAAFRTDPQGFDVDGLVGDQDAVRVVLAGLPGGWGGVERDYVYGSSAWILWLGWKLGDQSVRSLYEALEWNETNWASVPATFLDATGRSVSSLMGDFAEDFWLQRYPPLEDLSWSAALSAIGIPSTLTVTAQGSAPFDLSGRPPLSSRRIRLDVSSALVTSLGTGDVVFRATGLGAGAELSVWQEGIATVDPQAPELLVRLTDAAPLAIRSSLSFGTHWLLHNRYASTGAGPAASVVVDVPRILSLSPSSAGAGTVVQVTGQDLGATKGVIRVGGQPVTATSWSATGAQFTMPSLPSTSSTTVRLITSEGARTNDAVLTVLP